MSIVFIHAADIELVVFQPDTPIKSSEINENFSKLRDLINLSTPIGTVTAFAGKLEKIPAGWLKLFPLKHLAANSTSMTHPSSPATSSGTAGRPSGSENPPML